MAWNQAMETDYANRFKRSYKKMTEREQQQIKDAIDTLLSNPESQSLRMKKVNSLRNQKPPVWEISVNMDIRITFEIHEPKTILFRNVGHHDVLDKNP